MNGLKNKIKNISGKNVLSAKVVYDFIAFQTFFFFDKHSFNLSFNE